MEIKQTEQLCRLVFGGKFGLERETLRVTPQGYLSQTPHPFPGNPHIDRDFCESQIEIISPICTTISELYRAVECIDRETKEGLKKLNPPEYLWPFSNPPYVPSEAQESCTIRKCTEIIWLKNTVSGKCCFAVFILITPTRMNLFVLLWRPAV